jgi:uncharacterized protein YgbK (DUF1537 family)
MGLPLAYGIKPKADAGARMPAPKGRAAILAGSCSAATRGQIAAALAAGTPAYKIDPLALADGKVSAAQILDWIAGQGAERAPLVYSSADPADVARAQDKLGRAQAGEMIEHLIADIARALPERGFSRLIVAGGETSGAAVAALGVKALRIGPEIAPGVPWTRTLGGTDLALALKSGNFGAEDFFIKAWDLLE